MLDQLDRSVSFPAAMCSMQLILENRVNGTHSRLNHYPLNIKASAFPYYVSLFCYNEWLFSNDTI